MKIETITVGPLGVNCYIVEDPVSKEGMVIDPGDDASAILDYIQRENIQVKYIVNTHGHADHIGANSELQKVTKAKLCLHEADALMLSDPKKNLSVFWGQSVTSPPADQFLQDGEFLSLGSQQLKVLHTAGHSPGGICLAGDKILFSGDSLFAESIGRCDFPGGNMEQLVQNIKQKLLPLPGDTVVYPGHGPATKIGWERQHNPYMA